MFEVTAFGIRLIEVSRDGDRFPEIRLLKGDEREQQDEEQMKKKAEDPGGTKTKGTGRRFEIDWGCELRCRLSRPRCWC